MIDKENLEEERTFGNQIKSTRIICGDKYQFQAGGRQARRSGLSKTIDAGNLLSRV
jgi:hypothetical protein